MRLRSRSCYRTRMKMLQICGRGVVGLVALALAVSLFQAPATASAEEQKFDVLQIGTQTYRNVTVTTKSKDYVFILHSTGMANLKVKELPDDVRQQLGYIDPPPPKSATAKANDWAKESLGKLQTPQVKVFEERVHQVFSAETLARLRPPPLTRTQVWEASAAGLVVYLFFALCCQFICLKAGKPAGLLGWVPVFQVFPMLKAAGMSGWWFFLMPLAFPVWCVKMAKVRSHGFGLAFLLILPVINVLPFLYLAFSSGAAPTKEKRRIEVMSLEAA